MEWQDGMIGSLGRWDCAFHKTLLTQYSLYIPTRVAHVKFRVAYGVLGILTYEMIQAHYIAVLNRLFLAYRIVKKHSLGTTPVQGIASIKRSMLKYRSLFQFRMVR